MEEKELYLERKEKVKDVIYSPEYKPMKYKELAFLFQLTEDEKPVLSQILNELTEEGRIVKTPRGKYQRLDAGILCGTFTGNNRGFGFVTVEAMMRIISFRKKPAMVHCIWIRFLCG